MEEVSLIQHVPTKSNTAHVQYKLQAGVHGANTVALWLVQATELGLHFWGHLTQPLLCSTLFTIIMLLMVLFLQGCVTAGEDKERSVELLY